MKSRVTIYFHREATVKARLLKAWGMLRVAWELIRHGEAVLVTNGDIVGMPLPPVVLPAPRAACGRPRVLQ